MTKDDIANAIDKVGAEVHPTPESLIEYAKVFYGDEFSDNKDMKFKDIIPYTVGVTINYSRNLLQGVLEELLLDGNDI